MKKVAVITNAAYGVGRETALAIAGPDYDLVLTDRSSKDNLKEIRELCMAKGSPRCYPFAGDPGDPVTAKRLFNEIAVVYGGADILINIADVVSFGKTRDFSDEDYMSAINENLSAVYNCCRNGIPYMNKVKAGFIINIAGSTEEYDKPVSTAVMAAWAGIMGLTKGICAEVPEVRAEYIRAKGETPESIAAKVVEILG